MATSTSRGFVIVTALGVACGTAAGQSPPASDGHDEVAEAMAGTPSETGPGLEIGFTWVQEYWWRGYLVENQGFIGQPYAEVTVPLFAPRDGNGVSVDAVAGTWHSLQSARDDSIVNEPEWWFEADLYGGLNFGLGAFELGLIYTAYYYPSSDDFDGVQEVGVTLGVDLDDEHWTGRWLGDPSLGVYFETYNSNVGDGTDEASYLELGFGPSFDVFGGKATLSVPVALGFSLDGFYVDESGHDETFGYASVGLHLDVPLDWLDDADLTFNVGVTGLILGDTTKGANNGDGADAFVYAGLVLAF